MPPRRRASRASERSDADDASARRADTERARKRAKGSTATRALRIARATESAVTEAKANGPSTSVRAPAPGEGDALWTHGERAMSNSVPANASTAWDEDEDEDARDDGCSEPASSLGTSAKTSSLRARRSLPGLRLPNEAFDDDREDEGEREIESGLAEARNNDAPLPADGWIQPCFACSRLTWQSVTVAGFKVYRCATCGESFRARAAAMASRGEGVSGDDGDGNKSEVLASLMNKLRDVVDQVGGERLRGSIGLVQGSAPE